MSEEAQTPTTTTELADKPRTRKPRSDADKPRTRKPRSDAGKPRTHKPRSDAGKPRTRAAQVKPASPVCEPVCALRGVCKFYQPTA